MKATPSALMAACLLALPVGAAFAQTGTIASRVTDAVTGETLPGVNVVLEGAPQGGATDAQERYAITGVAPGAYTLVASFVGYGDQHEAGVELAFENDRWFTLLRTGRALEEMKRHAAVHRGIQTHWQEPAYNIEPHKLQYPLPQRELTLSPDLEQNSGW